MSAFTDFALKAWEPTKRAAVGFADLLTPGEDTQGVLSGAITEEARRAPHFKEPMPAALDLHNNPGKFDMVKLGMQAMEGAPIYTDSSHKNVYTPTKEEEGEGMDLQKLGAVLKSIKPADQPRVAQASSSRVGGHFRFDPSLYENPLLAREMKELYMQPLYTQLYKK